MNHFHVPTNQKEPIAEKSIQLVALKKWHGRTTGMSGVNERAKENARE